MTTPTHLASLISTFLSPTHPSAVEPASVGPSDIAEIGEILTLLIALKYKHGSNGTPPVEYKLVDRTRYQPLITAEVVQAHKAMQGRSKLDLNLAAAANYGELARMATGLASNHLATARALLETAAAAEEPLEVKGVRYVAKPPDGLTVELVSTALLKAISPTALRKHAYLGPDFRSGWMVQLCDTISRAISARLKGKPEVKVTGSLCLATLTGVKVTVTVPSLDLAFTAETGQPEVVTRKASPQ